MPWYAVQYKAQQGDRALQHLQNQDVECLFPKIQVEKIRAGKRMTRLEPLFQGYLFIRVQSDHSIWPKLRSTRGVLRVVSFAQKPAVISDEIMEQVIDGLDQVTTGGGLQSGQTVAIQSGPFAGLNAIFESYDGDERAIVLLDFLHRQQRLRVSASSVEANR